MLTFVETKNTKIVPYAGFTHNTDDGISLSLHTQIAQITHEL